MLGKEMLFKHFPGCFLKQKNQNNFNPNWKKIVGFRNMQKKLENEIV